MIGHHPPGRRGSGVAHPFSDKHKLFRSSLCYCSLGANGGEYGRETPLSIARRKMSSFSLATDRYRLSSDAALAAYPLLLISSCLALRLEHQIIHALHSRKHCSPTAQPSPPRFRHKLVFIYLSIVCFFLLPGGRCLVDIFSFNTLGFPSFSFSFTLTRIMARIQLAYLTCTFFLLTSFFFFLCLLQPCLFVSLIPPLIAQIFCVAIIPLERWCY